MMINDNNFYKDFDKIFNKLNIKDDNIYYEFINLFEKYAYNYDQNINLNNDLTVKTFIIDEDGLLKCN